MAPFGFAWLGSSTSGRSRRAIALPAWGTGAGEADWRFEDVERAATERKGTREAEGLAVKINQRLAMPPNCHLEKWESSRR